MAKILEEVLGNSDFPHNRCNRFSRRFGTAEYTAQKRSEELSQKMLDLARQLSVLQPPGARPAPAIVLSVKEKEILRLFAEGKSSTQVSRNLHISSSTLRNHLHHINQKLRTHNRLETDHERDPAQLI